MDLRVFYEVIVPMMEVWGTATICISTPMGKWNFYSELVDLRDHNGNLVFNVIKMGMCCAQCAGTERADSCKHPVKTSPDWKTDEGRDKVKAIFGNRLTMLNREILGQITDDDAGVFNCKHLSKFFHLIHRVL